MSIELSSITKDYNEYNSSTRVLEDVNLKLADGDSVSIIGRSGSGKSTLLHIMGLLDTPSCGDIFISGHCYSKASDRLKAEARRKLIGFVYQFHYLLLEFTVLENLTITQLISGASSSSAKQNAELLLKKLQLWDRRHSLASRLSGGEQQRIAVARALVNFPKIILADEPTGNLDETNSKIVADLLFNEAKERGASVVLVTHNSDLAKIADRSFILKNKTLNLV
ncbi:MAG: ABC transporter ATP-binding protein [Candidatus Lariskella arthropodorum]